MVEALISNLLLSLFLLLFGCILIGELFERIGLDAVLGYLLAGLLLGPSVFNLISPAIVHDFAIVGAVLILFLAGLKEEHASDIYKNKLAVRLGLSLLIGTFFAIFVAASWLGTFNFVQIAFLALAYSVVDLGVPAKLFISNGLLDTKFGRLVLNSGVINVLTGFALLVVFTTVLNPSTNQLFLKLIGIGAFATLFIVLHYGMGWLAGRIILLRSEEAQFSLAFALVILLAYLTESLGFSSILGAFLGGVVISRAWFAETPQFIDKFKGISLGLFVPLFFGWFGLELQLFGADGIMANIGPAMLFLGIAVAVRFIIAYAYMRLRGERRAGIAASSVLSLDVESLVILLLALEIGVFTNKLPISIFAPAVPLTTLIIVILFRVFSKLEGVKLKRTVSI